MPVNEQHNLLFVLCLASYLQLGQVSLTGATEVAKEETVLSSVLRALGWKNLTMVLRREDNTQSRQLAKDLLRESLFLGLRLSAVYDADESLLQGSYLVFTSAHFQSRELADYLERRPRPSSMMVLVRSRRDAHALSEIISSIRVPSSFYKVSVNGSKARLSRIQTFSDGQEHLDTEWFQRQDGRYLEDFDMGGRVLSGVGNSWKPWLDLDDCDHQADCRASSSGVLTDLLDTLGHAYNFNWTLAKVENWGVEPITNNINPGPDDYDGVMGLTMQGRYDVAVSVWRFVYERLSLSDYSQPVVDIPRVMLIDGEKTPLDLTLFLRPFTGKSWAAVAACLALMCFSIFVVQKWEGSQFVSPRIAVISCWAFFLLMNAFYGGALTMFLSSPPTPPFETLREGLTKHPPWDLVLQDATQAQVASLARAGDEPFAAWMERAADPDNGLLVPTIADVLSSLTRGSYFAEVEKPMVATFLAQNPSLLRQDEEDEDGLTLQQVGHAAVESSSFLLTKNSPWLAVLDQGLQKMRQAGTLDVIYRHHALSLPGEGSTADELETKVLGAGHTGVIFILFSACHGGILLLLVGEIIAAALQKLKAKRSRKRKIEPVCN